MKSIEQINWKIHKKILIYTIGKYKGVRNNKQIWRKPIKNNQIKSAFNPLLKIN